MCFSRQCLQCNYERVSETMCFQYLCRTSLSDNSFVCLAIVFRQIVILIVINLRLTLDDGTQENPSMVWRVKPIPADALIAPSRPRPLQHERAIFTLKTNDMGQSVLLVLHV